jgi:hypothetical protein
MLLLSFSLVILVPFATAYFLPRIGAFVLGPLILAIAAIVFVRLHDLFVPFQSDGSPAGLVVPGIMWLAFLVACIVGVLLIATGVMRLHWRRADEARRQAGELIAASTATRTWLAMFNVALGVNILVQSVPIGRRVGDFPFAVVDEPTLYRAFGWVGMGIVGAFLHYLLPALLLCLAFRAARLHRRFRFDARGGMPLLVGNVGVLFCAITPFLTLLPNADLRNEFMAALQFEPFVWVAWTGIPIGLFLLWTAQPARGSEAASIAEPTS